MLPHLGCDSYVLGQVLGQGVGPGVGEDGEVGDELPVIAHLAEPGPNLRLGLRNGPLLDDGQMFLGRGDPIGRYGVAQVVD